MIFMNIVKRNRKVKVFFLLLTRSFKMEQTKINELVRTSLPSLDGKQHKGQAGRIGIVGGSLEYTGAPYFAGISALKVGADLVHIFCTKPAATVIKSYSPELIVHPLLDEKDAIKNIYPWLERLHALVIGPGLGRENQTFNVVSDLIRLLKEKQIPLIIDADGLFLITENPDLIKNSTSPIILTPNKIEFERLSSKLNGPEGLKTLGDQVTILRKGATDEIYSSNPLLEWKISKSGSGRRCGGQGDLLSGSIATFLHWTLVSKDIIDMGLPVEKTLLASALSCYAASSLIRECNKKAFQKKGRSMLATDMIEYIHEAFTELYGE